VTVHAALFYVSVPCRPHSYIMHC